MPLFNDSKHDSLKIVANELRDIVCAVQTLKESSTDKGVEYLLGALRDRIDSLADVVEDIRREAL